MSYKELLSVLAIAMTFYAFVPYIRSIRQGTTRPHVFSWVIWGSTTFVVFLAQLADKGGAGAWPIGVSGIITMYVAYLAYTKKADTGITCVDWLFFIVALTSLPVWYITSDPVWSVIILTLVDSAGFVPTFRKAYAKPYEENLAFYNLIGVRNLLVIIALVNYSITTVLFPAVMAILTFVFVIMVLLRRKVLTQISDTR
jgi:hypothetical protein